MSRFVAFASARPGDPALKGAERVRAAGVVPYDVLVASWPGLDMAGPGAPLAGARDPAWHSDMNRLPAAHVSAGARMVRLKSGDSGIFGRLGEETAVGFKITPGVPAGSAAAGSPLTARRVQFTGADVTGDPPRALSRASLADPQPPPCMGQRSFAAPARGVTAHSPPPDTPAPLPAETADHPRTRATVAGLAAMLPGGANPHPTPILCGPLRGAP